MKFLGWMRHKVRLDKKETLIDVTRGNNCCRFSTQSSQNDQDMYTASIHGSRHNTGFKKQLNKHFQGSTYSREENFEDEMISELFHGFLAIGTLGGEPALDEPATPKFGMLSENPRQENVEVAENNLKFIKDELENFLEAETEEGDDQPSGRDSNATTIASAIKPVEEESAKEESKPTVFPLQGYFFSSSIELPETRIGAKKEKASLEELFQRTKIKENLEDKCGNKAMQTNPAHRSTKHLMKKLLKKIYSSSRFSIGGKTDSSFTKEKFQKIIKIFHRKVHPENSITEGDNNSKMASGRRIQYEIKGFDSAGNGEHWIKTDAELKRSDMWDNINYEED